MDMPALLIAFLVFTSCNTMQEELSESAISKETLDSRNEFIKKFRQSQPQKPVWIHCRDAIMPWAYTISRGAMLGSLGVGAFTLLTPHRSITAPGGWLLGGVTCAVIAYAAKPKKRIITVGRVDISGDINEGFACIAKLTTFCARPDIQAIVIKIDSSGGKASVSEHIVASIKHLKKQFPEKPIISFSEQYMCSAAYWIAATADYIITPPLCHVGGIGVWSWGQLNKTHHIAHKKMTYEIYRTGHKGYPNEYEETPEELKKHLQYNVNTCFASFLESIQESRPQLKRTKTEWEDGRTFLGVDAYKLGLIDQIGYAFDVDALCKELFAADYVTFIS